MATIESKLVTANSFPEWCKPYRADVKKYINRIIELINRTSHEINSGIKPSYKHVSIEYGMIVISEEVFDKPYHKDVDMPNYWGAFGWELKNRGYCIGVGHDNVTIYLKGRDVFCR